MYYLKFRSLSTLETGAWDTVGLGTDEVSARETYDKYSRVYKFVTLYKSETVTTSTIIQESSQ